MTLGLALLLSACASLPRARATTWDVPVSPTEPRANLKLKVNLESATDCDERFDLSIYEDRGVDLVTWDDASALGSSCRDRRVTVRYLPGRVSRAALLSRIRTLSKKMEIIER